MELLQLRYFIELAKNENLTDTARKLFISPSSLSLTISRLERELGIDLFDRKGRNIELNANGKIFNKHISSALAEIDLAIGKLKPQRRLNLITEMQAAWSVTIADFMNANPEIFVSSRTMRPDSVTDDMLEKECDFWLTGHRPVNHPELEYRQLNAEPLYLAVPDTHPLAKKDSVSLSELKNEDFIFPEENYASYKLHMLLCEKAGISPNIIANSNFLTRIRLVGSGRGITFVNMKDEYKDMFKHIGLLDIKDELALKLRDVTICWYKGKKLSPDAEAFLQFIIRYYRDV